MIRARALLLLGLLSAACHGPALAQKKAKVGPAKDFFKDTLLVTVSPLAEHQFSLRTPGQRDSLLAVLRRERALWRAGAPRDYRFLSRAGCFCPGPRGWLLIEVRRGQPLKAWDRAAKVAPFTDWDTFSIDGLFDSLERSADHNGLVQFDFDPRWHFPTYFYVVATPGPDMWATYEARGLRPIVTP